MERFPGVNYLDHIQEHVEPWSYLKFLLQKVGYPDGVSRRSARTVELADKIGYPAGERRTKIFKSLNNGKPRRIHSTIITPALLNVYLQLNVSAYYAMTLTFSAPTFSTPVRTIQAMALASSKHRAEL
ncbi:MAG: hypothetical protein IPJ46_20170 [Anaerolineales bacterium]|nr:hypothetical protein [Anaerolineales bacterium]